MKKYAILLSVLMLVIFVNAQEIEQKEPTTAVGFRFGSFGIPDVLLDLFIVEHPTIKGTSYAFEIRSFGDKGLKSPFSGLYSFEYNRMKGDGYWRMEQHNRRISGAGEITQLSVTATVILSMFPKLPIHPYIGAGIGIEKITVWTEGAYQDELGTDIKETMNEKYVLPVGHIPIGVSINIMNKVEIRIEGGFKNGFYFGGSAAYCF